MILKIATQFTTAPGPRYTAEGKFSGEEFRTTILLPKIREAAASGEVLTVDLDGTSGFGTSFLEESFGGLIRENGYSLDALQKLVKFISLEEPELLDEISEYMHDADDESKS